MKVELSPDELKWLNTSINACILAANKRDMPSYNTLVKMKFKFTPNASYVSLTKKERAMCSSLIGIRMDSSRIVSMTEAQVLKNILVKLRGTVD